MTADDWKRARDIFFRISELPPAEREAWLQAEADPAVRNAVYRLLERDEAEAFDAPNPASEPAAEPQRDAGSGYRIGPYRILEKLGEGGMGTVFLAEQEAPLHRTVAIKLIRSGLRGPEVRERFEIERRTLALMEHRHIARVFDAGETPEGRPYLVMEYVPGVSIHRYCDEKKLSLRARLELLVQVCNGIQHAHLKGVIHRDLKPSNVLITLEEGKPVAKIIDFSVAKAAEADIGPTPETRFGSVLGTVEYMSPEQAAGDPNLVDTRTDVYSLGALGYELITGEPPLASGEPATEWNLPAALERVRLREPVPPSHRVRAAKGDLDWIFLKALEKEPARRYQTANALAADILRHLDGDPVEAGPPSTLYRVRKMAVKYRPWIVAAACFAVTLIAATAISIGEAVRATAAEQAAIAERGRARVAEQTARGERDRAVAAEVRVRDEKLLTVGEKQRADGESAASRAIAAFLQNDLLAQANSNAQRTDVLPDPNLTMRAALDRAAAGLAGSFQDQPVVRAAIEHTIGNTYLGLGLYDNARQHLEEAAALRQRAPGKPDRETLETLDRLAAAYRGLGDFARAEKMLNQVRAARRDLLGPEHPETLQTLGLLATLYRSQGKYKEAADLHAHVLRIRTRVLGEFHPDTLRSANDLGLVYLYTDKYAEAEKLHRQTLERRRRTLGPDHPNTLISWHNLALTYYSLGRLAEAGREFRLVLAAQQRILGPAHPDTLNTMSNLGLTMLGAADYQGAARLYAEVLDLQKVEPGKRQPTAWVTMHNLALADYQLGEYAEARRVAEEAVNAQRAALGPEHPDTIRTMQTLAAALRSLGDLEQAATVQERVVELRRRLSGPEHRLTCSATNLLARIYDDMGRFAEAAELAGAVRDLSIRRWGEENLLTVDAARALSEALAGTGNIDEALRLAERALEVRERRLGPDHPDTLDAMDALALIRCHRGELTEAATLYRTSLKTRQQRFTPAHLLTRRTLLMLNLLARAAAAGQPQGDAELTRESIPALQRTAVANLLRGGHVDHSQGGLRP